MVAVCSTSVVHYATVARKQGFTTEHLWLMDAHYRDSPCHMHLCFVRFSLSRPLMTMLLLLTLLGCMPASIGSMVPC